MTGAERAQPQAGDSLHEGNHNASWLGAPEAADMAPAPDAAEPAYRDEPAENRPSGRARVLGALLLLLALAWIGAFAFNAWQSRPDLTLPFAVSALATLSGPLVLLALLWVWLGRTPRREAIRFTRAVEDMRRESTALESVLAIVAERIEANHSRLRGEAERLMSLGDEASDRLGRVTHYLSKESAHLDRSAATLDSAASAAKVDIGVLLHDLPKAEEQARAVADAMKEAGLAAHGQAGALEAQLAAIAAKGRDADELLGGAAQRLAAHVARIETGSAAAAATMGEASAAMTGAVDSAMARAAEAVDAARAGLDAQSGAMLASIEQSHAMLERAGEDAARSLSERLELVSAKIEGLAGHLATQDAASHALVTGLAKELAELEDWFRQLGTSGTAETDRLSTAVGAVRESMGALVAELSGGREQSALLIDHGREATQVFGVLGDQLATALPASLGEVEIQAERTAAAVSALAGPVAAIHASSGEIEARVEQVASEAERIRALLTAQDESGRALVHGLIADVSALEERFAATGAAGAVHTEQLGAGIAALRGAAAELESELGGGETRASALADRAQALAGSLDEVAAQLRDALPQALEQVEAQAEQSRATAAELAPIISGVEASAAAAAARLSETESSVARQRESLDALLARIDEGSGTAEEKLEALGRAAVQAQQAAAQILAETAPQLVDAMVRVRETANQAAERAREAISAVIPASAAALGEAGRAALSDAISSTVERQMAELAAVSERALNTARGASERLTRQMLSIGETAAAVEERIEQARKSREEKESENFSRRVALLIESLNSTAIDVTKILSNDVTDSAWAAYLKGDRGVFTRRAVRLLDATETREIARHYEEEPEFREQVNRYIHDFEAMLRRILADRDGSPLSVTILSSDMGKLYVALAQAIDRLRK
jgi:chromosome segregation ATPase